MLVKIIDRIIHACWYLIAVLVLAGALLITLIRVLLPHANEYRDELQNIFSRQTGYTITIENVQGDWQGWVPTLYLNGIDILTAPGKQNITHLESAFIRFDPFTSFRLGQFTLFHLTITGPELTVVRSRDGSLHLATDGSDIAVAGAGMDNAAFSDWLLLQKTISIRGATVRFMDARKEFNPILLSSVDLLLKNSISHMQLEGSLVLPDEYGEKCLFALDIYGDIATPGWSGQIYVAARHTRPEAWLSHFDIDTPLALTGTTADVSMWSYWQQAQLIKINGLFDASNMHLARGTARLDIQHINSLFTVNREEEQTLRLKLKVKELLTSNGAWPETEISVISQSRNDGEPSRIVFHSNFLNIRDILALAGDNVPAVLPFASEQMNISGSLLDCLLVYDPSLPPLQRFAIDTGVRELNIKNETFSLHHLQGSLSGTAGRGLFRVDTPASEIDLAGMLNKSYTFHELQGDVRWYANKDSLRIETAQMQAHTLHFNAVMQGSLMFAAGEQSPFVDMIWSVSEFDLENVKYYLPLALPEKTRTWISHALVAGDVSALDVILRGPLADFPFDNNEGRFEVIADIHNATLDYHQDWIPVDNIEAELRIDSRTLTVEANAGNLYNAVITRARATIDKLHADTDAVSIQGEIRGQVHDAIKFINNTPLSTSPLLSELGRQDIDGPFKLELDLHIPFEEREISYNGNILFDDATLKSETLGIELEQITGAVAFSNNSVATDNLGARYAEEPVSIIIDAHDPSDPAFGFKGHSGKDFITGQLVHFFPALEKFKPQLAERLAGGCDWTAMLSPAETPDHQIPVNKKLDISSTLSGLAINLPAPLGKTYDTVPLAITTIISPLPGKHIEFSYGDELKGGIDLDRNGADILSGLELALGAEEKLSGEGKGIRIHGAAGDLSLSDWYSFLHTLDLASGKGTTDHLDIDITARTLYLLRQNFWDTQFRLLSEPSAWHVMLDGAAIAGEVLLPKERQSPTVHGAFSRLVLSKTEESGSTPDLDPGSFPPLQFAIDNFKYQDISLGKVDLATSPRVNGMSVDKLAFTKPGLQITGNGTWSSINGNSLSDFALELQADTLAEMLTTFNYSVEPVKDGLSRFKLNARWPGSPTDFTLAGINGTLDMEIDKGQFLNIEPKAGRLFGLLNLQSLIRLLSLDFTVLFSKGYVFDHIDGTFTIESGNAYTNNLAVKGRSADITITGRTGLVEKDYDQIATVIPHTLFGPIGAGLGAVIFIAGEVFESLPEKFDKLLQYQYTIKGSWDAPVIEKYNSEF